MIYENKIIIISRLSLVGGHTRGRSAINGANDNTHTQPPHGKDLQDTDPLQGEKGVGVCDLYPYLSNVTVS
jgi:hypothetical protein